MAEESRVEEVAKVISQVLGTITGAGLAIFINFLPLLSVQRGLGQAANRLWPNEIFDPQTLALHRLRGIIDEKSYLNAMLSHGYQEDDAKRFWLGVESRLDLYQYIDAWRRGELTGDGLATAAQELGFAEDHLGIAKRITEAIPSPSDIIRFAVREAYDDYAAGQQDADRNFDKVWAAAAGDARSAGLSELTLKRFWRSHWELPSPSMGYDMLQRGIIPRTEAEGGNLSLEGLLRMADYMPGWIQKMIDISYNVPTRVDVRRMHKYGIYDDDDLIKAYQRMGYEYTDAEALAYFTILQNLPAEERRKITGEPDPKLEKDLSKAEIISGYSEGLLERTAAAEMLSALGYDAKEVALLLAAADAKIERTEAKEKIDLVHEMYIRAQIDTTAAVSQLVACGLTYDAATRKIALWDVEISAKMKRPSIADLMSWYSKGYLNADTLRTELAELGYPEKYIVLYVRAKEGGKPS